MSDSQYSKLSFCQPFCRTARWCLLRPDQHISVQTPTPHPQAYREPRACVSRPARGPLDDHFQALPASLRQQRSRSLPAALDSRSAAPFLSEHHASSAQRCAQLMAPGTNHTPAACTRARAVRETVWQPTPSDLAATSADFRFLSCTGADASDAPSNVSASQAANSLTPRISSLSVSASGCDGAPHSTAAHQPQQTPVESHRSRQVYNGLGTEDRGRVLSDSPGFMGTAHLAAPDATAAGSAAQLSTCAPQSAARQQPLARPAHPTSLFQSPAVAQGSGTFSPSLQHAPCKPSWLARSLKDGPTSLGLDTQSQPSRPPRGQMDRLRRGNQQDAAVDHAMPPEAQAELRNNSTPASTPRKDTTKQSHADEGAIKRQKRTPLAQRDINSMRGGVALGAPARQLATAGGTRKGLQDTTRLGVGASWSAQ